MNYGMEIYYFVPASEHVEIDYDLPRTDPDSGFRIAMGVFIKWRIRQDMKPIGDGGYLPYFLEEIIVYNIAEKKFDYVVPELIHAEMTFAHHGIPK